MDESKDRKDRELAEQQWRKLSAEEREMLREVVRRTMAESPDLLRAPYEEVALPEVVDRIVIKMLTVWQAQARVRMEEHVTDEDVSRWMIEAINLLPDDAPEDMVIDVAVELMRRERPQVMGSPEKRA